MIILVDKAIKFPRLYGAKNSSANLDMEICNVDEINLMHLNIVLAVCTGLQEATSCRSC